MGTGKGILQVAGTGKGMRGRSARGTSPGDRDEGLDEGDGGDEEGEMNEEVPLECPRKKRPKRAR